MMRRSAHRLTQSVLATKVAVGNAAGTGRLPNLHIGLIFCYAALSAPALDQMYSTWIQSDGLPWGLPDANR
jgi:hypothetical protein